MTPSVMPDVERWLSSAGYQRKKNFLPRGCCLRHKEKKSLVLLATFETPITRAIRIDLTDREFLPRSDSMKFYEWMRLAGSCPHAPLGVIARNEKEGYEYSSEQGRQHRFSKETVPDTWVDLTRILGLDCSLADLLRYGSLGGVCKRKRKSSTLSRSISKGVSNAAQN